MKKRTYRSVLLILAVVALAAPAAVASDLGTISEERFAAAIRANAIAESPAHQMSDFEWLAEVRGREMYTGHDSPTGIDLLAVARQATARYQRLEVAEEDGFVPLFECIAHETDGAMGFHYINPDRFDSELTLTEPEALVYEELPNGEFRLMAVEFVIPAAAWTEAEAPAFLGQTLKYKTTVGSHEVDPYYEVHVWVWGHNPSGMFADWNPAIACSS
jgi:hypothetical protein